VVSSSARAAASGQDAAASNSSAGANVVLGGTEGTPGEVVVVPIYFTPPQGVQVGSLKIVVNFVSANLKYDKLERGIAAEMADAEVKGDLTTAKNANDVEESTLTVLASAPATGNASIPSGLLAYISLHLQETARPANITLRTKVEAAELKSNKSLDQVRSADGTVEVIAPGSEPLVACFFFTH
jgi:hypothetical protein